MKKIILASTSPRRKNLLENAGVKFDVIPSNYEEKLNSDIFTYKKIENLAYNKALDVANNIKEDAIIIGADTVVVLNDKILTKPKDRENAFEIIKSLSNVEHQVVTAICIIDKYENKTTIKSVTTKVQFNKLTDEMINNYIDEYKPFDKAGAYGIQELPENFVNHIDGSFENVVGLCTKTVKAMIN